MAVGHFPAKGGVAYGNRPWVYAICDVKYKKCGGIKEVRKLTLIAFILLLLIGGCSGCSLIYGQKGPTEEEAMAYVQSELDNLNPQDELYDQLMESLLEEFQKAAPDIELDDTLANELLDVSMSIFDVLQFSVCGAEKNENEFVVFVDVEPLKILAAAEKTNNWLQYRRELYETSNDNEAIMVQTRAIIDFLNQSIETPEYENLITLKLHIVQDDDGYYTCAEEDVDNLITATLVYDLDSIQHAISEADEIAFTEIMTTVNNEPVESVEMTKKLLGEFSESSWNNIWFRVGFELDEGWWFEQDILEEMQESILSDYEGTQLEKFSRALNAGEMVFVVLAYGQDLMIDISIVRRQPYFLDEDMAISSIKSAMEQDVNTGIPTLSEGTVAGIPHRCVDVEDYYDGYSLFRRDYVIEQDDYFLIIGIHGYEQKDVLDFDPFYVISSVDEPILEKKSAQNLSESPDEVVLSYEGQEVAIRIYEREEISKYDDSVYLAWDEGNCYWNLKYSIWYNWDNIPPESWLIEDTSWYEDDGDYSDIYQSEVKQDEVNDLTVKYVVTDYTFMGDMYHHTVEIWTDMGDEYIIFAKYAVDCFEQNYSFPTDEELVKQAIERTTIH